MARFNSSGKVFKSTNLAPLTADLTKFLRSLAGKQQGKLQILWRKKLQKLIKMLSEGTPAYTGSAAGSTDNAKVDEIPKWHPAYGMNIGNAAGDTGWQLMSQTNTKGFSYHIINPMWFKYLVYVNAIGNNAGFVDRIWEDFRNAEGF